MSEAKNKIKRAKEQCTAAFSLLQEEMKKALQCVADQITEATAGGDYAAIEEISRELKELTKFAQEVEGLARRWQQLVSPRRVSLELPRRRWPPRGRAIPHQEYVLPILRFLRDAGGLATTEEVRAGLERIMGSRLGADDRELVDQGRLERWWKRAQWVRYALVQGGYLSDNSPKGVWEITPQGEALLDSGEVDVEALWRKLHSAQKSTPAKKPAPRHTRARNNPADLNLRLFF